MRWIRFAAPLLILAAPALAAPVNPALFQDLRWRLVGPFRGGRVLAVSGAPGEPDHFYFGAVKRIRIRTRMRMMPSLRPSRRLAQGRIPPSEPRPVRHAARDSFTAARGGASTTP